MGMVLVLFVFGLLVAVQSNEGCGVFKDVNQLPWNVGIYVGSQANNLELICIGTAIKPGFVVTAAHCFCDDLGQTKADDFYVSPGKLEKSLDVNNKENLQKVEKQNIFINRHFKGLSARLTGDLAVVKLQNSLSHNGFTPICIDWDNTTPNLANEFKLRHPTWQKGRIKVTDVSYIDPELCQSMTSASFLRFVTSDKVCARSDNDLVTEDVDTGGGLMYLNIVDNLWYIRGVVSGHDLENKKLVFYSNINIYLNWISGICAKP